MNFYKNIFGRVWNWLMFRILPDDALKDFRIDDGPTPVVKTQKVKPADLDSRMLEKLYVEP